MAIVAKLRAPGAFHSHTKLSVVPRGRVVALVVRASSQLQNNVHPEVSQAHRRTMLMSMAGLSLALLSPATPVLADEGVGKGK